MLVTRMGCYSTGWGVNAPDGVLLYSTECSYTARMLVNMMGF